MVEWAKFRLFNYLAFSVQSSALRGVVFSPATANAVGENINRGVINFAHIGCFPIT